MLIAYRNKKKAQSNDWGFFYLLAHYFLDSTLMLTEPAVTELVEVSKCTSQPSPNQQPHISTPLNELVTMSE